MEHRRLGKSGVMGSELGFGGHQTGGYHGRFEMPLEQRAEVIARGLELGITYFDTTADPEPESLSAVFKLLGGKPAHVTVTSMYAEYKHLDAIEDAAAVKARVRAGIEGCLTHFAPIDVLNLCGDGLPYSRERTLGAVEAMEEARSQGKVAHFGFSTHQMDYALSMIRNHPEFCLIMFPFNVVLPRIAEILLPVAAAHGVAVVAMKALAARGLLNLGIEPTVYGPDVSLPVAAIKWVLQHPEVACTVPAMNSIREVDENARASGARLTEAEKRLLERVTAAFEHRVATDPKWYFHRDWTRRLYGQDRVLAEV